MRLLIVDDGGATLVREVEVTGLGTGLDKTGELDANRVQQTMEVLESFGATIAAFECEPVVVVATAASRDARNGADFIASATSALGYRPAVIGGEQEARLAYNGAMAALTPPSGVTPIVVDIGGGSTEFVDAQHASSHRIGSVRITDRLLSHRPVPFDELDEASRIIAEELESDVAAEVDYWMVGVAGTWTSLAALIAGEYDPLQIHGSTISRLDLDRLTIRLASLDTASTAQLPGLHPKRAPVILGGALIAREAMRRYDAAEVTISESDLLDALVQPGSGSLLSSQGPRHHSG
jgi:exopolyphosphatase/guanosine-5'-triphosphate,3'-diphosphate pyrophosphatase